MIKWVIGLVVIILLAVGGYYLFAKQTPTTTPTTQTTITPSSSPSAMPSITGTQSATQNVVTLTSSGFSPATLTIKAGQSVTWTNSSGEVATINSDPHPTHTNYPPLNLGSFADGASLSLTFPTPGTYGYHNHLNPSEKGTIVVQ